jgi:hypothetical protein
MVNMTEGVAFTEQEKAVKKKALIEALEADCFNMLQACEKTKTSYFTALHWTKTDDDFAVAWETAKEKAKERRIDFAECKLHEHIAGGDTTSTFFFLKTIARQRGYGDRVDVNTTVTHEIDITEAAKRIAFAMNQAIDAGVVLDGQFTEVVPMITRNDESMRALRGYDEHKTKKAKKVARKSKKAARAALSSSLTSPTA